MGKPKDTCPWVATTKKIFLSPFNGWSIKTTDGHTIDGATATGAQTEIGSTDMYGFDMDAAGEAATLYWLIPADMDVASDVSFNVVWTPIDGTVGNTITWKVLYSVNQLELGTAMAAPSTALGTAIAADAEDDTPHAPQASPTGIITGGTLTTTQRDAPSLMGLYIEADAISAGNGGHLLGITITYTVRTIAGA